MPLSRLLPLVGMIALASAASVRADEQPVGPDARAELVNLYTLSVAIDTCEDLDVSDTDENKLDKAISAVEAKLALTEEASAALYDQLSAAADSDKAAFCGEVGPRVKAAIDKLSD